MIVAKKGAQRTLVGNAPQITRSDCGGFHDTPAGYTDRDALLAHLNRDVIHASLTRDFSKAYYISDGIRKPRFYRVNSEAFSRCQYAMLTNKQYAAVLVTDIDRLGTAGGHPSNLAPDVKATFAVLIDHHIGPAWLGINPISGKAQAIWLIDPVYANKKGKSPHMSLLTEASKTLGELLDHDPHFAHRFSRSPFYTGDDPTAYRWYCQHKNVYRLADLLREVRRLMGVEQYERTTQQKFSSGRELILAAKARREQAEAFKAIADDVEASLSTDLDQYDPELVEGVRILWISPGRAARDETAFRHALRVAHKLRQSGQRMKDTAIIDAYEHAYRVAQQMGAAGRESELPPMRDRLTMARRVRGYVLHSKTGQGWHPSASDKATTAERKALATMGRKGGQKAAQRWKTDPNGEYAQQERTKLAAANKRRNLEAKGTKLTIAGWFLQAYAETGSWPTIAEAMQEFSVSRNTVKRALKRAGISLPSGRRSDQK